ncbi:MAG TPA: hypothetical protein VFA98_10250 [Thermoanaerobaculia bacterium]|jgi:hypothetical protein|nr:hypothetical protein [Thermoanaerobaculia bacterium]
MSREVRAVVLGLFVVVLAALALSFWRRPAAEFQRIKGFRVEIRSRDGGETRHASFNVPSNLLARLARLAPKELGADMRREWSKEDVTPRQILDAAEESAPGKPGVIKKDDATIEVMADGGVLEIDVKDEWDKHVHIRLPRVLIEALSDDKGRISTSEILEKLDELGPGDVVTIQDHDNEVTITAQPYRKHGIRIS